MFGIDPVIAGAAGAAGGGAPPAGNDALTDYASPEAVYTAASLAGGGDPTVAWIDDTGNGNDVTGDDGGGGTAYSATSFDGTHGVTGGGTYNDALVIPEIALVTGPYTILAFAKFTSDSGIVGHRTSNVQVRRDRSSGNNFSLYGGTEKISAATAVDHTSIHMAVWEFDGTNLRYQCNELDVALVSADGSPGTMTLNRIFRTVTYVRMVGTVGQIGIWKSALGKSTCDDIYNNVGKPVYTSLP